MSKTETSSLLNCLNCKKEKPVTQFQTVDTCTECFERGEGGAAKTKHYAPQNPCPVTVSEVGKSTICKYAVRFTLNVPNNSTEIPFRRVEHMATITFVDDKFSECEFSFGGERYTLTEWKALEMLARQIEQLAERHEKALSAPVLCQECRARHNSIETPLIDPSATV